MKRIRTIALIVTAALAAGSLYFRSARVTLSVIAGSAVVMASFEILAMAVSRAFCGGKKSLIFFFAAALLKLTLLGFVLWFVVARTPVHAPAFLAGLSTIVLSVGISGIVYAKD